MIEASMSVESDVFIRGTFIHASAVAIAEKGILIRGDSGAGKSELALTLVFAAQSLGSFARLVGDDRIHLEKCSGRLIARGHPTIRGTVEWRGQGIFQTVRLDAVVLDLVVDLVPTKKQDLPRLPADSDQKITLDGVDIAAMRLPIELEASGQAESILRYFRLRRRKISVD
jgi:HPr kinase/phosphorylase